MRKILYLISLLTINLFFIACNDASTKNEIKAIESNEISSPEANETKVVEVQEVKAKVTKKDCDELTKKLKYDPFESVKINNLEWMTHNLDVDTFRNGDKIFEAKTDEEWRIAGHTGQPAWCYYNNNPCNSKFGKLYNFHAVDDPRGLAPEGWQVASDEDWIGLVRALGDDSGYKLKSKTDWFNNGNGGNTSGLDIKPNGIRYYGGDFMYYGRYAYLWTSSTIIVEHAHLRYLRDDYSDRIFATRAKRAAGLSVRCVKEYPENVAPYDRIDE